MNTSALLSVQLLLLSGLRPLYSRTLSKAEVTKRLQSLKIPEPEGLYEHFGLAQCPIVITKRPSSALLPDTEQGRSDQKATEP